MNDCNELRPYELLIRWDELTGEIRGAAFYERRVTVMGGELIRNELQDPQAVDHASPALAKVLDAAAAAALATVARLEADVEARDKERLELRSEIDNKAARIGALEAEVAAVKSVV